MDEAKKQDDWTLDVAALSPKPAGHIKIDGTEYPIFNFLDCDISSSIMVAELGDLIVKAETYEERIALTIKQLVLLSAGPSRGRGERPALTSEIIRTLEPRTLMRLAARASGLADVPPVADASASVAPSPASADSTAGDKTSSSA
jgi:hypothetical protein